MQAPRESLSDHVWFAAYSGDIGCVTPSGHFSFFPSHLAPATFFELVTGADGKLWFVEPPSGKLARMNIARDVTEFDVGAGRPFARLPRGHLLAVGANGDVCFPQARLARYRRFIVRLAP